MTDTLEAPDAWNPADECLAWNKVPRVIGSISHTHVCRQSAGHEGAHICGCSIEFTKR